MHRRQENLSSISLLLSRLLILSFRGTLEALQGMFYAGSECFRAKCFEEPTPPAWGEDEVSAILDATGGRLDGSAGDVWVHLQAQWEKSMQAELVSFGIDLFDLEDEVQGAALSRMGVEVSPATCGRIMAANRQLYGLEKPQRQP